MAAILHFFTSYYILIYLFLFAGLLFAFRRLAKARNEIKESFYGLEREIANRHSRQAITAISLIFSLAIAELALVVFLAPNLPAIATLGTPTINPMITPTSTIPPELLATLNLLTPLSSPTAQMTGCIPGQIMISSPKPGEVVKGQVTIMGTVNVPNFGFYKYEFSALGTENWSTIQASHEQVTDSKLGNWDTSEITPGDYNLRLVVRDSQGNALPPCVVPVSVVTP
jgi:hypothetical protein